MNSYASDRLMKNTAVCVILFTVAAMAVMLHFASTKTIVIAQDMSAGGGTDGSASAGNERRLLLEDAGPEAVSMRIPLPEEIKPDNIVIENRYTEHQINVLITGAGKEFYAQEKIGGNLSHVMEGAFHMEGEAAALRFTLDGLYEYKYLFKNSALYLEFVRPREMYDRIVVIDAAHGGEDTGAVAGTLLEKELTLDIAQRVRARLEETDIRVYCTRLEDTALSDASRAALANALQADLLVSIHAGENEQDPGVYGTLARYNAEYVIPVFGNAELADLLERTVVAGIDGKALGIEADSGNGLLSLSEVPAAVLEIGCLTNEREAGLLGKEGYRQLAAEGICEAVLKYYEQNSGVREHE